MCCLHNILRAWLKNAKAAAAAILFACLDLKAEAVKYWDWLPAALL